MAANKNMEIYNRVKAVPDYAKKPISDGRMKGKTDISPMWRIEALTETFGPCGIGWWYVIKDQRLQDGADGTVKAFVDIDLYYKWGDQISQPIPGIGGNTYIAKERNGLYTDDEAFKKALSDAISVAAKALGVGADIYMGTENTKYSTPQPQPVPEQRPVPQQPRPTPEQQAEQFIFCEDCKQAITGVRRQDGSLMPPKEVAALAMSNFGVNLCFKCGKKRMAQRQQQG